MTPILLADAHDLEVVVVGRVHVQRREAGALGDHAPSPGASSRRAHCRLRASSREVGPGAGSCSAVASEFARPTRSRLPLPAEAPSRRPRWTQTLRAPARQTSRRPEVPRVARKNKPTSIAGPAEASFVGFEEVRDARFSPLRGDVRRRRRPRRPPAARAPRGRGKESQVDPAACGVSPGPRRRARTPAPCTPAWRFADPLHAHRSTRPPPAGIDRESADDEKSVPEARKP